jgi:predicted nucleic acid-binding Zn ribbon protein
MPTYVYRFLDTGETIEVRQSFEDEPLTQAPHPSDGSLRPVKKVFTPVGVTFKGSGFYKTDSPKSTNSGASTGGASSSESPSDTSTSNTGSGGTSSSESKTAKPASSTGEAKTSGD